MKWKSQKIPKRCVHVLISNDFPPKIGGIQNYLFEIYSRLPPDSICVITTTYPGDAEFDSKLEFPVIRLERSTLLPTPSLVRTLNDLLEILDPDSVALDPLLPLGLIIPWLRSKVTIIVWGAEVVIPASLPVLRTVVAKLIARSNGVVAGGKYALDIATSLNAKHSRNPRDSGVVYPGVDTSRFVPVERSLRGELRRRYQLEDGDFVVLGVSRLVPRKGMDTLIEAAAIAGVSIPNLKVIIGGDGRQRRKLEKLASRRGLAVQFTGRVSDDELLGLYQIADVFAMLCRSRWWGLEQEGFGIVFLEAAACGIVALAGDSGGASEAVDDAVTGFVIRDPTNPGLVAERLVEISNDPRGMELLANAARRRACENFDYEIVARQYREFFAM